MKASDRVETFLANNVSYLRNPMEGEGQPSVRGLVANPADVNAVIDDWPVAPKKVAAVMIERYGPPHEATPARLLWHGSGAWKRLVVQREEIPHRFPTAHTDFLTQTVDYHVPAEKFDELARFDGSVLMDRTAGEMAARCNDEPMNVLALNLAHEIVTDQRTVEEARDVYAENAAAYLTGRATSYTDELAFDVRDADAAALDQSVITEPEAHRAERLSDTTA